jgi:hypothetical protein
VTTKTATPTDAKMARMRAESVELRAMLSSAQLTGSGI